MKNYITILFLLIATTSIFSQRDYDSIVEEAWDSYSKKQWKEAGLKYLEAFEIERDFYSINDKYNAGKALGKAGMVDEAFEQFFYLAKQRKYSNFLYITESDDLKELKSDSRWKEFIGIVKRNKEKNEEGMDSEALAVLDKIRVEHDRLKAERIKIGQDKGYQSQDMRDLLAVHQPIKDEHLLKVKRLLDEKGFLGPEEIGVKNRNTVFNILRTARIETHDEYLPIFEVAFREKKLTPNQYASIIDRISLMHENRQVYGSIFTYDSVTKTYFIVPVIDPENVNERRAKIGEMTIEKFCEISKMKWNVEEHKKMSIEYDKKNAK